MVFEEIIRHYTVPLEPVPVSIDRRARLKHRVKAVLFDIYGTLFISKAGDISIAKQESFENLDQLAVLLGRYHVDKTVSLFLNEFFGEIECEKERMRKNGIDYPEVNIEQIWETVLGCHDRKVIRKFAVEYEVIVNPVYPMPHINEVLTGCRKKAIPMGIISNAQFYTPYLFSALLDYFPEEMGFDSSLLFYSYLYGYGKPSLYLFEKAASVLEKTGLERKNVLYVGNDMLKDIYTSHKAGFQTALFAGDGRSLNLRINEECCKEIVPDLVITDLVQVLEYL